ncbi:unnamed protein product [Nezara viridula]|uniref:Aminopeptidase n=1 Tax=Nezara viridula TaxID=85310 RepID=A0A9P0H997_NEZVI|nr:unnamed protein product [Nezara viridula]
MTDIRKSPEKKAFERLPNNVKPLHYDLRLKPNLRTFVFDGKVEIKLQVNEPTCEIIFNALELEIKSCVLLLENGSELRPNIQPSLDTERVKLVFNQNIPVGTAQLTIKFKGESNDKTEEDQKCYYAETQFEAPGARRYFPCWDEPAIKSVFEVTLITAIRDVALSNMPVVSELEDGDYKIVKFAPTPIMSTYLVGFVVGDFDYIEDNSNDGILIRVYAPPEVKKQGRFALNIATKVLPYYQEYFQVPYPLPKMDLVAIEDLPVGGMGKWGLVSYRQSALLVDSSNASASQKQLVTIIIALEIARQWFGNLVTMEWWTQLWLYEGFITFIRNLCLAHLFPEYDIWTEFVFNIHVKALELDCLKPSHALEVPVEHPSEVNKIFDDVSYNKSASLIRMLNQYLGDSDFKKGMHIYLTRHQYDNTFTEDLWNALEEASQKPVKDMMSTWTKLAGFPVINIINSEQTGDVRELTISQDRFCGGSDNAGESSLWMVPLTFSTESNPHDIVYSCVLETKTCKVQIPAAPGDWVKLNPDNVGFYRTHYARNLLDQFIPAMRNKSLPLMDRLNIVDDLFALVQAGHCLHDKQLRSLVLSKLGTYGDPETIKEAKRRFSDHVSKRCIIPLDLRTSVYQAVISEGDQSTFDTLIQMYKTETSQEEKERIYASLGAFKDANILLKVLNFAMSDEVSPQDKIFVIISVATDIAGRTLVWEFLKKNWTNIYSLYKGGFLMTHLVKYTVENFSSHEMADEVERFFASKDTSSLERTISKAVESAHLNARWLSRDQECIRQFLQNHEQHSIDITESKEVK